MCVCVCFACFRAFGHLLHMQIKIINFHSSKQNNSSFAKQN